MANQASEGNKEFELRGVNHVALVCEDMARTVDFYTNVLGMPLTKTIDLPGGMGQHFFFDMAPARQVGEGSIATAHGSMNHIAFDVAPEKMEEYRERLVAKGIEVTEIVNHDNSPMQASAEVTDDVFVRSMYFWDPDGIMLEFAAWTREIRPDEAGLEGVGPAEKEEYLAKQGEFLAMLKKHAEKKS